MQTFKAIFVGGLLAIVAVTAFTVGRGTNSDRVRQLTGKLDSLAEGWVRAQAVIVDQGEMNDRLEAEAKKLDAKYRKAAGENVKLRVELDAIRGGGPAEPEDPGQPVARYEDKIVQLSYNLFDREFGYLVKGRPIVLSLIQQGEGITANAYDPDLERTIPISRVDYYKVPVKERWYRKLHLGPGVGWDQDGWKVGIKPGAGKWHVPVEARLEGDRLKYSAALYRDLW